MRDILIFATISTLAFSGLFYGWRFLKIGNVLLGWEWIILGASASNMFLLYATEWTASFWVMTFFDSFSRSIGVPVIGGLGIIQVLHNYEPPKVVEAGLSAGGFALALFLITAPSLQATLPAMYIAMGTPFLCVLLYLSVRLFTLREYFHSLAVVFAVVAIAVISLLEGVIVIPGDEHNLLMNLYFIAHVGWALSFAEIYYACVAFLRALALATGIFTSGVAGRAA